MGEPLQVRVPDLGKMEREGVGPAELARAKSQLQGNMLLGMESTDSRMNRLARNEISFRRDVPLEELSEGIEAVTNDNIVELASTWFKPDKLAMVLLGDLKGRKLGAEVFAPLA